MAPRILALGCFLLTMIWLTVEAARAAEVQVHEGSVVSAASGTLVIADKNTKQHSFQVDSKVPITVHGKPGKLEDLKKSMAVKVTTGKDGKVMSVATVDTMKQRTFEQITNPFYDG